LLASPAPCVTRASGSAVCATSVDADTDASTIAKPFARRLTSKAYPGIVSAHA
jgi:hypothetical protein